MSKPDLGLAKGMAKMSKLGQSLLDLRSRHGEGAELGRGASAAGRRPAASVDRIAASNSALKAFRHAKAVGFDFARARGDGCLDTATQPLEVTRSEHEIVIFDRSGRLMAPRGFRLVH